MSMRPRIFWALSALLLFAFQARAEEKPQSSTKWSGHNFADEAKKTSRRAQSHAHGHQFSRNAGSDVSQEGHRGSKDATAGTTGQATGGDATASAASGTEEVHQPARSRSALTYVHEDPGAAGIPRDPFVWDGESSWEWDNPRTLYFEPVAGLGNRLRALASAVVLAKEFGVGLKVIWRLETGCENCGNPGFNSSWTDLFSEPRLRLVDNFPASNYSAMEEMSYLRAQGRDDQTPPLQPGQCLIHYPHSHHEMLQAMRTGWTKSGSEEVLCVKSDLWLTEAGEKEGKFFFRLLKPSVTVQGMIDRYKYETEWEENHMVGVHVRRGDLTIYGKNNNHNKITTLIPIESYIQAMQKQKELAAGVKRVRFFLATDDAQAEAEIKAAFKPGYVMTYSKSHWSRLDVAGIQEALLDVMLLADCPVLIGTYYSSYSETAKMMGWPFYIQIGHALKKLSIETVIEKDDPDEESSQRRLLFERQLIEQDF